jgi:hypothetical protein
MSENKKLIVRLAHDILQKANNVFTVQHEIALTRALAKQVPGIVVHEIIESLQGVGKTLAASFS